MAKRKKKYTPKFTAKVLGAKIDEQIEALANATDEALVSSAMTDFLDSCATFHRYSVNNQWLIQCFHPGATFVAGFNDWKKKHNRHVKKGGTGIPILAPNIYKADPNDDESRDEIRGFRVVYVYDVSSTDGEPLAPTPNWKSPEKNEELNDKLVEFAASNKIEVVEKEQAGDTQGVSRGGTIEIAPEAGTKTLVHEIAHELMHKDKERLFGSRKVRELQAESVAYVVAKHFGLEELASPNYIALHGASSEDILKHLGIIRNTATKIIKAVEK